MPRARALVAEAAVHELPRVVNLVAPETASTPVLGPNTAGVAPVTMSTS